MTPDDRELDPPLTANEKLLDSAVHHAVQLERLKAGEGRRVDLILAGMVSSLREMVLVRLDRARRPTGPTTTLATSRRLQQLGAAMNKTISEGFAAAHTQARASLDAMAVLEAQAAAAALKAAVPADVTKALRARSLRFDFDTPSERTIRAMLSTHPVEGRLLRGWFTDLAHDAQVRTRRVLNNGLATGQPIPGMARAVVKAADVSRAEATRIVRTAAGHVSAQAREATWADNEDLIESVQWVATLDGATCPECGALDGQTFEAGKGERPPAHILCRCSTIPNLRSWRSLGIDAREIAPSSRASMNGQVPESLKFPEWLEKQPIAVQNQSLGRGVATIWRREGMPFRQLVSSIERRPLTLAEVAGKFGTGN
jgi:SPP1 gp7 family putative phage head morphogenesis protein